MLKLPTIAGHNLLRSNVLIFLPVTDVNYQLPPLSHTMLFSELFLLISELFLKNVERHVADRAIGN